MRLLAPRGYAGIATLASAAMLATAHAFERFGGYQPCLLCLRQREVYWAALALGLVGWLLLARLRRPLLTRGVPLLLALVFLAGAGVAGYHAGVEQGWWPGPTACAVAKGGVSAASMSALAGGAQVRVVSCEDVVWAFLGLSMAGWNTLVSLALAALGFMTVRGGRRAR